MKQKPEFEYTVFKFIENLAVGEYKLSLFYNATLGASMAGFYRSTYAGKNGTRVPIATTQFESTDARRAFPCLDEPSMKAIFEISIAVEPNFHAISNMPVEYITKSYNQVKYQFFKTKVMSTYLVAWVISDFEKISQHSKNGIEVNVYTTPNNTYLGEYVTMMLIKGP